MQREKAAYQILRKKGLSYNTIAEGFGRAVSVVYNSVKRAVSITHRFGWNIQDLRKLPRRRRIIEASRNRYFMFKLRAAWEAWVCGEGERPP